MTKSIYCGAKKTPADQRGSVLLIAMVFLLILAAIVASSLSGSVASSKAIGNMQWRNEAVAVANAAVGQILSGTQFATNAASMAVGVNTNPTSTTQEFDLDGDGVDDPLTFDMNGDGIGDIRITMPSIDFDGLNQAGPRCIASRSVLMDNLVASNANDIPCFGSSGSDGAGIASTSVASDGSISYDSGVAVQSVCSDSNWVIPVRASDAVTKTSVDIIQGASVRVFRSDALNFCK